MNYIFFNDKSKRRDMSLEKTLNEIDLAWTEYHERMAELNDLEENFDDYTWLQREQIIDEYFCVDSPVDWADKIMSCDGIPEEAYAYIPAEIYSKVMSLVE